MRDIRSLIANTPERFRALNFEETFRTVPGPNNSERQEIYFIIHRDGFMLLVMGYTGKKALAIKLAYIEAFNAMEAELSGNSLPSGDASRPSRRSDPERKALTAIINTWVSMAPIHYASARARVNAHFGVASVDALTIGQVRDAIRWVQEKIDALQQALPAQVQPASLPAPIDEKPFLEFIKDIQSAHEEVSRILSNLHHSVFTLSWKVAEALGQRADIRLYLVPDMLSENTLRGYLYQSVYHDVRKALTAPG